MISSKLQQNHKAHLIRFNHFNTKIANRMNYLPMEFNEIFIKISSKYSFFKHYVDEMFKMMMVVFDPKFDSGGAGYRSRYLSHAKRALYHLSYAP